MKCFFAFKDKSKSQQRGKSQLTPELKPQSGKSGNYPENRGTTLAGSVSSPRSIAEMYKEQQHNLRVFSFSELRSATSNFNENIGEGGFGRVFKGTIRAPDGLGDPIVVAIKILNPHGLQGHKQWLAEVIFLSVVDHPNLVKLVGYCCEDWESENGESRVQLLLVYEYMPKKSLENHLFNMAAATLPWKTRLQIILGAAQGLAYLHDGLEVQVIFRDFKTSNVLLDEDFKAKLSDFGLAREGPVGNRSHVSTEVLGSLGYTAPEYMDTGHLTRYSDVYSFGVVLYEILTGRRTLERTRPSMEQWLVKWVKQYPADSDKFSMIIDPRLENQYSVSAARKIAKLADSCLVKKAKDRPTMSHVVESLKQAIEESEMGSSTS
ncbi:probable serine/threonine-protein kinase PBL19 [Actinidia eriantha]|uniref:probable serine/threonine-protein kinase PBL19 n=1 Tax=Actinidia eriantha TaxID=165200 RepID=UPI002588F771|nr:probable serine/threonine-protein kinase PBL19 [Actinidia eriantha]